MPMARTRNQPSPISGAPRVPMEGPEPRGGAPVVGAVMGAGARGGERTTISRHPGRRLEQRGGGGTSGGGGEGEAGERAAAAVVRDGAQRGAWTTRRSVGGCGSPARRCGGG